MIRSELAPISGALLAIVTVAFMIVLAAAFNVTMTLHIGTSDMRIGLSDFLLPGVAIIYLCRRFITGDAAPIRLGFGVRLWLAAFSVWITVSLIIGRIEIGAWQSWALVNKWAGWFVLVGYFLFGAQFASESDDDTRPMVIVRVFIFTACAIALAGFCQIILAQLGLSRPFVDNRQSGMLENPNAFGASMAVVWAMMSSSRAPLFSPATDRVLAVIALVAVVFSGSRGAGVAVVACAVALLVMKRIGWRELAIQIAFSAAAVVVISSSLSAIMIPGLVSAESSVSIKERQHLTATALAMWLQHPVIGAGLGTFLNHETVTHQAKPDTIHTTAIWLLTETGLIGLLLVAIFGFYCLRHLAPRTDPLARSVLAMLIVLGVDSVANELMYQRYLWFFLGMSLVMSRPGFKTNVIDTLADRKAAQLGIMQNVSGGYAPGPPPMAQAASPDQRVLAERRSGKPMAMLTVVLSNFNHARFLPDCLEALIGQTRPADELIIIDDASADDSVAVISSFLSRLPNARLLRNPLNLGCVPNMNRGLEMAQGDIAYFAAADDVTYPTLFEKGMALLEAHPEAAIFSARSQIIDAFGNDEGILATPVPLTKPGFIGPSQAGHELMRDDGWFLGNTSLFRLRSLQGAGGFPADLGAFADGYISRLLALKHGACFSPEILAAWRRMEGGMAWSRTMNLDDEAQFVALVERKMSEAGGWFPPGYAERWKRRYIFGARRFMLVQVRRKAALAGTLAYFRALAAEALFTAWWFLTLRPWDIAAVFRRRFRYLIAPDRIGKLSAATRRSQRRRGVFDQGKSV